MDLTCGFRISFKKVENAHSRNVMWSLAVTLAATVIIFASLGSIQNQCRREDPELLEGVSGFSSLLSCKKVYRYYWFITSFSFVTGAYGFWVAARDLLSDSRAAVMGLLVIANLLTINMTDAFYTIFDIPKWQDGVGRDRARTMVAGCIITAVFQAVSILLVGMDPSGCCECTSRSAPACTAEPAAPAAEPAHATASAPVESAADPESAPPAETTLTSSEEAQKPAEEAAVSVSVQ